MPSTANSIYPATTPTPRRTPTDLDGQVLVDVSAAGRMVNAGLFAGADASVDFTDHAVAQHLEDDHARAGVHYLFSRGPISLVPNLLPV